MIENIDKGRSMEELEEYLVECTNMPVSPWEGGTNSIYEYAEAVQELVEKYHDRCDVSFGIYGIKDLLDGEEWKEHVGEDVANDIVAIGNNLIKFINQHPGTSLYNEVQKTFGSNHATPSAPEPF